MYIIPLYPHLHTPLPPFSPSLISLMVDVDVKHHVYLLLFLHHAEKHAWAEGADFLDLTRKGHLDA